MNRHENIAELLVRLRSLAEDKEEQRYPMKLREGFGWPKKNLATRHWPQYFGER